VGTLLEAFSVTGTESHSVGAQLSTESQASITLISAAATTSKLNTTGDASISAAAALASTSAATSAAYSAASTGTSTVATTATFGIMDTSARR
jgi:hypothetical protein